MTPAEVEVAAAIRLLVEEHLPAGTRFGDDEELAGRLDSMQLLVLVTAVEDRFRVVLTPDDAAETRSLADLARLVSSRCAARPGGEAP